MSAKIDIRRDYFELSRDEFRKKLKALKNDSNTSSFFVGLNEQYYFNYSENIIKKVLSISQKQWAFDFIMSNLSPFVKKQVVQHYLLEEINATNEIENIYVDRNDIFYIFKNLDNKKDKPAKAITKSYYQLLENEGHNITSSNDIKKLYLSLMGNYLSDDHQPDGKYYRKNAVGINAGFDSFYHGFFPENNINKGMEEFLKVYKSDMDLYTKAVVSHFLLEIIHPYYEGNGKLGRYLMSNLIFRNNNSFIAFAISSIINNNKADYYKAFKDGRDSYEFGFINKYVEEMLDMLEKGIDKMTKNLFALQANVKEEIKIKKMSKKEEEIYKLLHTASIISDYGISLEEIVDNALVSRRTVIYTLNKFKKEDILIVRPVGKYIFYKIREKLI